MSRSTWRAWTAGLAVAVAACFVVFLVASKSVAADADDDAKFVNEAAKASNGEIDLGKMASEKATDPAVKAFGERMVTDHKKINADLKAVAEKKGMTVPEAIASDDVSARQKLEKKTGADFDKDYVSQMVTDHKNAVSLFEKQIKDTKDTDLKSFAEKTIPMLRAHLQEAQTLSGEKPTMK